MAVERVKVKYHDFYYRRREKMQKVLQFGFDGVKRFNCDFSCKTHIKEGQM
jgi:hypothetical protein